MQCDRRLILMTIYNRDIRKKLIFLRLSFLIIVSVCFFGFTYSIYSLATLAIFVSLIMSTIGVEDLSIYTLSFVITKSYFFGFIKFSKRFEKNKTINVKPIGGDFGNYEEAFVEDPHSTGIGCLLSIFFFLLPRKKTIREFYLEMLDENKIVLEKVYANLNKQEFGFIKEFLNKKQCT